MKISIIGLGFVGNSMLESFNIKNNDKYQIYGYDKYKNNGIGNIEQCQQISNQHSIKYPTNIQQISNKYPTSIQPISNKKN